MAAPVIIAPIDGWIIGIIGVSLLIGFWRGLAKELIALMAWVLAIWGSILYAPLLMAEWAHAIPNNELRLLLAWAAILLGVLLLGDLIKWGVGRLVSATPFKIPNHFLGGLFGFARGILFLSVLVFLSHLTQLPRQPWWESSTVIPLIEKITHRYYHWLPEDVKTFFVKYSDQALKGEEHL